MARYRRIDTGLKLLPVDLCAQLLPGTLEHALSHLIDHELDLRVLDERFKNDESGAPAYAPSNNKGLNRFPLRGRQKVDTQWKLFCLVHNIEKLAHHEYAQ